MINRYIKKLVSYGIETGLLKTEDKIYATNQLLEILRLNEYEEPEKEYTDIDLEEVLKAICNYAFEQKIIDDNGTATRDLFETKLMNVLLPRPSEVIHKFQTCYKDSPKKATDYFYQFSQDSNYIRRYRVSKDIKWVANTRYGDLDITINLSKPEKDPKAIAAAKNAKQGGYPKCLLCKENEGYAGRINHPARQNHRIIPIQINNSQWGFQYSPYVYYNEHCIIFNGEHIPMKVEKTTFKKLFDFIKLFPHYFIGSNADLPIVGGSILSHDHFQGGNYEFAMAKAPMEQYYQIKGFEDIEVGIVRWPLSVIRVRSKETSRLVEIGDYILKKWREYTDEEAFVYAYTNDEPHNTITPIARKKEEMFELDLTLRNNITTKECPLGLYHPHNELHHIKKENIGLIEVMGLAVLPARLKDEMQELANYILDKKDISQNDLIKKHVDWVEEFIPKYREINQDNIMEILMKEIGIVFTKVLEDAGVFKCDEKGRLAFKRFIKSL
ncbi:UTP-hexose-1-phosphate uridylyltransferase [Lachnotalea glycerini]|uniref:Galactose-1-phosphate uridylyltransferase n=2 Tax=Lachnotalea glycerini TaxID=1763509 RepID=A0A318ER07_9FIRM|nr:UDP-glucose--hexose-1-phosphate uridylyltransferase [Lachnotalea glycerini]PXV89079.1 UTP-hexose-1-phosphate uridylyltransferase [Lachnotalea glycerini]